MKKILFFAALLFSVSLNVKAQSTDSTTYYKSVVDTMNIVFTAPVGTEMYVAHYVNEPGIALQVAMATTGVQLTDSVLTNDGYRATITVSGATIIKCFEVLRNAPEGYAAEENKKLLNALLPVLSQNYALAYVVGKLREQNEEMVLMIKRAGAAKIKELQKLLE